MKSMPITFTCPHCKLNSQVDSSDVGQTGPCRGCGKEVTVLLPRFSLPSSHSNSTGGGWLVGCAFFLLFALFIAGGVAYLGHLIFRIREQERRNLEPTSGARDR